MKKTFTDMTRHGVCEVCGKEAPIVVAASTLGACSNAYCEECLNDRTHADEHFSYELRKVATRRNLFDLASFVPLISRK